MKQIAIILCSILLLSGCGQPEEPVLPPLSARQDSFAMDGWEITSFSPFCGYVQLAEVLNIYPYFDMNPHISMKVITLSGNPFLELTDTCVEGGETVTYDDLTLVTDGVVTYGYRIFGDKALVANTDSLPMGYVRLALEHACLSPDS